MLPVWEGKGMGGFVGVKRNRYFQNINKRKLCETNGNKVSWTEECEKLELCSWGLKNKTVLKYKLNKWHKRNREVHESETLESPHPDGFTEKFYQIFKRTDNASVIQAVSEQKKRKLLRDFYKARRILTSQPNKDGAQGSHKQYYMAINEKILYKILANRLQQHVTRIIHHNQVVVISGIKG